MHKKLLVIDDDAQYFRIVEARLKKAGFNEVVLALSGKEGIICIKEYKPEIVIVDTQMPEMDGFETCKQIKELESSSVRGVILITGEIETIDPSRAREVGVDEYCVKSLDCESLLKAIKRVIS